MAETTTTPATQATGPSLAARLGWAAFAVLVVYVLLLGGTYAGVSAPALRLLSLAIITIGLGCWAVLAWRRPEWRPRTAIWPAFAVPLLVLALTTILSPWPRLGLDYVAWATILVALYLFLVRIMSLPLARERIGGLAAVLGILLSLTYIVLVVVRWFEWWDLMGRFATPMLRPAYQSLLGSGPTIVAPTLILLAAVGFGGLGAEAAAGARSRGRRALLATLAGLTTIAVVLTGTRAAWLALAVALALVVAGVVVQDRGRLRTRAGALLAERRARITLAVGAVAAILVLVVAMPILAERLAAPGDGGRGAYATIALRQFEASPLVGLGPGTWAPRRMAYTEPGELDYVVPHAHNIYAQTLAESGLLGALAGLVVLGAVLWLLVGGIRDADPRRRRWSWAATFTLLYLALHSFLDGFINLPHMMLLAALPLAVVDATSPRALGLPILRPDSRWGARLRAGAAVLVFVAAGLAIGALFRIESLAMANEQAVLAAEDGDWAAAAHDAALAVAEDPDMPPYQVSRGLAAAAADDWGTAALAFVDAVAVDDQPETWLDLGLALHELGRPAEEVEAAIAAGLRIGDQQPSILVAAGSLYDRIGEPEGADEAFTRALRQAPSLAGDDAFVELVGGQERFERLLDQAMLRSAAPWELALMASQPDVARSLAAETDDRGLASRVIEAWEGDAQALTELQQAALANPDDAAIAIWAARASAHAGDAEAAARFRRLAAFGHEGQEAVGYETRIAYPDEPPLAEDRTSLSRPYGYVLYRRSTPETTLAAQLPSLVLWDGVP